MGMRTWLVGSGAFSVPAEGCSVAMSGVVLMSDDMVAFLRPGRRDSSNQVKAWHYSKFSSRNRGSRFRLFWF